MMGSLGNLLDKEVTPKVLMSEDLLLPTQVAGVYGMSVQKKQGKWRRHSLFRPFRAELVIFPRLNFPLSFLLLHFLFVWQYPFY